MDKMQQSAPSLDALRKHRAEILRLAARYGASNVRVFGSVARGDARPDSDIDLLVVFAPGASLFDLSGLWQDLQELLGRRVDVVSEGGMGTRFRARIEKELTPL